MNAFAEYRLRNDLAETRKIGSLVEEFVRMNPVPAAVRQALDLSLVEWVTNVVSYAYADADQHWISIRLSLSPGEVRAEVEDDGRQFDPLTLSPPDTSLPLEQRPIGGLGMHMIRELMDTVEYRRENDRNILTLIKRLA